MSDLYLGIAASLNGIGIAVLDERGTLLLLTSVGSDARGTSVRDRVWRYRGLASAMCAELGAVTDGRKIAACCIEAYSFGSTNSFGSTKDGHIAIIEGGYELRSHLTSLVLGSLHEVSPTTLKKWATGKGACDKSAVVSSLTKRYGVEFDSDNEADAYALARLAYQIGGCEGPATDKQYRRSPSVQEVGHDRSTSGNRPMTQTRLQRVLRGLHRKAMGSLPLTEAEVLLIYDTAQLHGKQLFRLCESHERLRMELVGAQKMLDDLDRKVSHGCTDASCSQCDQEAALQDGIRSKKDGQGGDCERMTV